MVRDYAGDSALKSIDEGGEVAAWLAVGDRREMATSSFYQPDHSSVGWVPDPG